ncbi:unnamed protein product, partial [marine sediment metagenome]
MVSALVKNEIATCVLSGGTLGMAIGMIGSLRNVMHLMSMRGMP